MAIRMAFSFLVFFACIHVLRAHMSMAFPKPRPKARISQTDCQSAARSQAYLTWEWNEPMVPMRPCTCHGTFPDATVPAENVFNAGDTISVKLSGSAFHNGGQCSFWWSTDGVTFKKFVDFNHCTKAAVNGQPINIVIPAGVDTQCSNRCILGWTWTPVSSRDCEIYMTCADVRINGATGGGNPIQTINFNTGINSQTCRRADPATGWSATFTPHSTTGMTSGGGTTPTTTTTTTSNPNSQPPVTTTTTTKPVVTARPTTTTTRRIGTYAPQGSLCNPPGVPNWGPAGNSNGQCGPGVGGCDWGQCCSTNKYCGPELKGYDAQGNPQYHDYNANPPGVYANAAEAFGAYCNNPLADYRLVPCCAIVNGVYYPALATCYKNYSPESTTARPTPSMNVNSACSSSSVPCQIKIMGTSNEWWIGLWIENSQGTNLLNVKSVQARGGSGRWVSGVLQTWNSKPYVFQPGGSAFTFPISLKIALQDGSAFYACNTIKSLGTANVANGNIVLKKGIQSENVGCAFLAGYNTNPSNGNQQGGGSSNTSNSDVGLIITLSVGGVVLVALIIMGCIFLNRRSKQNPGDSEYALMNDYQ